MKKIKPFFLAAKSKKAHNTLKLLSQKYHNYNLKEANTVVVLGGDGTILSLINDEIYLKKKIFGMNRGTIGFLMNNYQPDNLIHRISVSKETKLNPVQMKVTDINNKTYADVEKINEEIRSARRLFSKQGWPVIDVTRRSVEETAAAVIQLYTNWQELRS